MKLEDQVTSLGLSKRLKELGVKQDSLFYWHNGKISCPNFQEYNVVPNNWYSAFTVSELGEIIPEWFESYKRKNEDWIFRYFEKNNGVYHYSFSDKEVYARAEMLIYLLENDLIKNS